MDNPPCITSTCTKDPRSTGKFGRTVKEVYCVYSKWTICFES